MSFHNFFQMTRLVKAFYSKGSYLMGDLGEKVDNSTLKILNQSACFASLPDFDGFFRMNFRLYGAGA